MQNKYCLEEVKISEILKSEQNGTELSTTRNIR